MATSMTWQNAYRYHKCTMSAAIYTQHTTHTELYTVQTVFWTVCYSAHSHTHVVGMYILTTCTVHTVDRDHIIAYTGPCSTHIRICSILGTCTNTVLTCHYILLLCIAWFKVRTASSNGVRLIWDISHIIQLPQRGSD